MLPLPHAHHDENRSKTTRKIGVTLEGAQHKNERSLAKGIHISACSKTESQDVRKLLRVFVDLRREKHVVSIEGSKNPMNQKGRFLTLALDTFQFPFT